MWIFFAKALYCFRVMLAAFSMTHRLYVFVGAVGCVFEMNVIFMARSMYLNRAFVVPVGIPCHSFVPSRNFGFSYRQRAAMIVCVCVANGDSVCVDSLA